MFPESKVTEIYCMADDFCKEFTVQQEKYMIEDNYRPHLIKIKNRKEDFGGIFFDWIKNYTGYARKWAMMIGLI